MKERPILMSSPMVRALLEGRKTQTRRVVKSHYQAIEERDDGSLWPWREDCNNAADYWYPCPHGKPGDRLWVREKWAARGKHTDSCSIAEISANRSHFEIWYADSCIRNGREQFNTDFLGKWRPSIFMPRNLSRILLEITSIRVERLQDISEEDAIAEGVDCLDGSVGPNYFTVSVDDGSIHLNAPTAIGAYRSLWEWINGAESWDANQFVWVISFKRIEPK